MNKKAIAVIMSMSILICNFSTVFAGDYTSPDLTKNSTFNRANARTYAENWANGYNTSEYYNAGDNADCTNYVSQVLEKGGMSRITTSTTYGSLDRWVPHSGTWENAEYFKQLWGNTNGSGKNRAYAVKSYTIQGALDNWGNIYNYMFEGDAISYIKSTGIASHTQVVSDYGDDLYVCQHSDPLYRKPWKDYLNLQGKAYFTYVTTFQIKNGK